MSKFLFKAGQSDQKSSKFFRISAAEFPALRGIAIQDLDMKVGDRREPHLHPNAMQMDYCISGKGQVGIIGPDGERHLVDLLPGDAAFIPSGYVHWIENTDEGRSRFILIVTNERPETIEVADIIETLPLLPRV
ncbi:MAG: cupin domain-containing protein [Bosea sp. (in: a-proteobacteria)]